MSYSVILSLITLVLTYVFIRIFKRVIKRIAKSKQVPEKRIYYIEKVFDILFVLTSLVVLAFVWSVDIKGVSVFASSLFAIIGVAMFAQWSILSNITASIIIFFTFPARVGDKIKIIDGDNSIEGTIKEITLFQIELSDSEGNLVIYPNNLLLQKPVVKIK